MILTDPIAMKVRLGFSFERETIEQARQALVLRPDVRRALFMAEKMRPDFVFHTAALEGNPFTFPEVKTLIDGTTVGGRKVSDAEQVLNINASLTHVIERVKAGTFRFNADTACTIQGIVARNEALTWGEFRDDAVYIAGTDYRPPAAARLPEIFALGEETLQSESDPVLRAFLAFLWGSLNQFFYDGNKRTSRLMATGILLSHGLPPLMVLDRDRGEYNQRMTDFYNSQEATSSLLWMLDYYRARIDGFGFDQR